MKNILVVLGCGVNQDGNLSRRPRASMNEALSLLEDDYNFLFLTGGGSIHGTAALAITEAAAMKNYAINESVHEAMIIIDETALDTLGNFQALRLKFPGSDYNFTVVVSNSQMARAKLVAHQVFGGTNNFYFVGVSENYLTEWQRLKRNSYETIAYLLQICPSLYKIATGIVKIATRPFRNYD
ncbi:MAG: YdcF family protein [candidate division WWE3 bacterium]|nr:YdcF family protein [candidate division WWE3 bacterium]